MTEFSSPSHAPVKTSRPWTQRWTYKSGKTPAGLAAKATPEDVKAGFSYYNGDAKETVFVGNFAALIVATLSGVSGTVPDGTRYINYYSSLVFDTRTDPIRVFMQGSDKPVATGLYRNIDLPAGANYTQYLICYIPDTRELVCLELTVGLQNAVKRAIGEASRVAPGKVSLFNLCDLSSEFWGIRFSGEFEKRNKSGEKWENGDMFFIPKLSAGVVNMTNNPELVATLNEYADAVRDYANGYAKELRQSLAGSDTPPPAVVAPAMPTTPAPQPAAASTGNAKEVPFADIPGNPDDLPF